MKFALRILVFGAVLSMCCAGPSAAQYMKLLSDNPTDPTRLRSSGTTILTVTLDTNHDKDGSLQTCNSHSAALGCGQALGQPLDMFSYSITLTAAGGTVTWGSYTTAGATTSGTYSNLGSGPATSTQIEIVYYRDGDGSDPPGLYTLGSIPVTIVSGSPRIEIARGRQPVNLFGFGTGFGSYCEANNFPNTYVLGDPGSLCDTGDWFDADGVDAPSGTHTVTLAVLHEMAVAPGSTADQAFSATDPDGNAITFSFAGPAFMTVTSNAQAGNTRTGTIHLAPPEGTSGTFGVSVTASAGGAPDTRSFTIRVQNTAPTLAQPNDMTVNEGSTADQVLSATDSNGDPLTFRLVGGPRYASVSTTAPGTGSATGNIHLAPGFSDAGTVTVAVGVSDGESSGTKAFRITVNNVTQAPTLVQPGNMRVIAGSTANQTLTVSAPDADPVTYSMVSGPAFMTVSTAGNVHLAPLSGDTGSYSAIVRVSVGTLSDEKGFTIQVDAPNNQPVLTQPADMTVNVGETADQALSATDPDGQPLSFTIGVDPHGYPPPQYATVTTTDPGTGTATGNLHLAPTASNARDAVLRIFAMDGGLRDIKLVNVTVPGGPWPPLLDPICNIAVVAGSTADQEVTAMDRYRSANWISFSFTGPAFMTLTSRGMNGSETYAHADMHLAPPPGTSGTFPATVTATYDFNSQSASQSFTITVTAANQAPTLTQPADMTVFEGATADQSLSASDPEGDALTFSKTTGPSFMTVSSTGAVHLTPMPGDAAGSPYAASVTVLSDTKSFAITVNVAPAAQIQAQAFGRASPNPFNPSTTISFTLSQPGRVRLRIYDVSGRLVNTLADQFMGAGPQEVRWNATDKDGSSVSSGVYFYTLETPGRVMQSSVVVAK